MTPPKAIRLATRASKLALWQAGHVAAALSRAGHHTELIPISTAGDRLQHRPLHEFGGKGLFIKELEQALREKRADLAVHSLKDLPAALAPEFRLGAILERHSPLDVLVINPKSQAFDRQNGHLLGANELCTLGEIVVATGSLRRTALLHHYAPRIKVVPLRGNIDTRLKKMEEMGWDAIVLAEAGVERLDLLKDLIHRPLDPTFFVPSPAQGAIAIEVLKDSPLDAILGPLNSAKSAAMVLAERWLLAKLGGDCTVPIGCLMTHDPDTASIRGRAVYFDANGKFFAAYRETSLPRGSMKDDLAGSALKLAGDLYRDLIPTV